MLLKKSLILPSLITLACGSSDALDCPPGSTLVDGDAGGIRVAWCEAPLDDSIPVHNGPYKKWSAAGALMESGEYANGKKIGDWRWYSPEAELLLAGQYANGQKTGTWEWYSPTGETLFAISYDAGTPTRIENLSAEPKSLVRRSRLSLACPEGAVAAEFESHEIHGQGCVVPRKEDLLPHGRWQIFKPRGGRVAAGEYWRGELVGNWVLWDEDGNSTVKKYIAKEKLMDFIPE